VRLSHLTTWYTTGVPFITPGGMIYAFGLVVLCALFNDNIGGAWMAFISLLINATSQWVLHRAYRRTGVTSHA